jgi:hypothetical protein
MAECKVTPDSTLTLVLRVLFKQNASPITTVTSGSASAASDTPGVGLGLVASPSSGDIVLRVVDDDEDSEL